MAQAWKKPKTESPSAERVRLVQARPVRLGSALAYLRERFSSEESLEAFIRWRNLPETLLLIETLRELAENPPAAYVAAEDIGVQYGVSSGISLAAAFIGDPTMLYAELFTGSAPGNPKETSPDTDFTVAGDAPGR
jgi:hypothetical protein